VVIDYTRVQLGQNITKIMVEFNRIYFP